LVECFERLTKDSKFHVRRTLACSLHELAAILNRPALTERHILPALDAFLKDLDEVKVGVIKNLAKLLKFIPDPKRCGIPALPCSAAAHVCLYGASSFPFCGGLCCSELYLETLWDVHNQSENWRWRQLLAEYGFLFECVWAQSFS
jgi:hypothetical protein